MTFTILHANIYKANRRLEHAVKLIASLGPDIGGINEGINAVPRLRKMRRHSCIVNKQRGRGQWDTAILVHKRNTVQHWRSEKATKAVAPLKIAPARYTTSVAFLDAEGVKRKHFNVHLNAVLQNRTTGAPLVRAARVIQAGFQMALLELRVRAAKLRGRVVTISGDFNYRDRKGTTVDTDWRWSPQSVFTRLGMDWWTEGIDYIAFPKTYKITRRLVIPTNQTGSDHPWMLADLERR